MVDVSQCNLCGSESELYKFMNPDVHICKTCIDKAKKMFSKKCEIDWDSQEELRREPKKYSYIRYHPDMAHLSVGIEPCYYVDPDNQKAHMFQINGIDNTLIYNLDYNKELKLISFPGPVSIAHAEIETIHMCVGEGQELFVIKDFHVKSVMNVIKFFVKDRVEEPKEEMPPVQFGFVDKEEPKSSDKDIVVFNTVIPEPNGSVTYYVNGVKVKIINIVDVPKELVIDRYLDVAGEILIEFAGEVKKIDAIGKKGRLERKLSYEDGGVYNLAFRFVEDKEGQQ